MKCFASSIGFGCCFHRPWISAYLQGQGPLKYLPSGGQGSTLFRWPQWWFFIGPFWWLVFGNLWLGCLVPSFLNQLKVTSPPRIHSGLEDLKDESVRYLILHAGQVMYLRRAVWLFHCNVVDHLAQFAPHIVSICILSCFNVIQTFSYFPGWLSSSFFLHLISYRSTMTAYSFNLCFVWKLPKSTLPWSGWDEVKPNNDRPNQEKN